jgi:chorismate synthase
VLRFITSGESHGQGLIGIIEGLPAGLAISEEYINKQLERRQKGYGRGGRMAIEKDQVQIIGGIRNGNTLGSPVSFLIKNLDYENWQEIMSPGPCPREKEKVVTRPRPGHADLAGAIKYHQIDMRNVLERASARETAARVAAGAFFKKLLEEFSIYIYSQVVSIGEITVNPWQPDFDIKRLNDFKNIIESSSFHCYDKEAESQFYQLVNQAREQGESLGGSFEVGAIGVPPGLGSHVSWERRMDALLAGLLMSIPAIKAVEIGDGFRNSYSPGSKVHDEVHYSNDSGLYRLTNRAGGIEGGISNGEVVWARAYMKPIPTLYKPLVSVNTSSWVEEKADIERSDICAVPAAAVVGEAMLAFGIARLFIEKFGGDHLQETRNNYLNYKNYMKKVWQWVKI